MKNIIYIIILFFFFSCNETSRKKIKDKKSKFSTSDASEIFFKNVRQRYYDRIEMQEAKLNIYRLQERSLEADYPNIILAIVINWSYDEAYILLEPNELVPENEIKIMWVTKDSLSTGNYTFNYGDKISHFEFASQIYSNLNSDHVLFIFSNNENVPFLNNDKDRDTFRKTMRDYYRLIDLM
ncbi:MAG: hypothetical protein M3512_09725 [Bacteroidota bacterium]|nr:hypothetical protein [Bacteroidota bacterium]